MVVGRVEGVFNGAGWRGNWPQVEHVVTLLRGGQEVVLDTPTFKSHRGYLHFNNHNLKIMIMISVDEPCPLVEVKRCLNERLRELDDSLFKIILKVPANKCNHHSTTSIIFTSQLLHFHDLQQHTFFFCNFYTYHDATWKALLSPSNFWGEDLV